MSNHITETPSQLATRETYRATRRKLGTQADVAALLGIHRTTLAKRESALEPISTEAALAMRAISRK